MQHVDSEKCNLQEEIQKLLEQNDSLTAHYKSMLQARKLESINLFHQLLSTKMNSNENALVSIFISIYFVMFC